MTELYYQETEYQTVTGYEINGNEYKLVGVFDDYNESEIYQVLAHDKENYTYTIGTITPIENGIYDTVGTFFEQDNHDSYFEPMSDLNVIVETLAHNHTEQLAKAQQSPNWKTFVEYMADYGTFL